MFALTPEAEAQLLTEHPTTRIELAITAKAHPYGSMLVVSLGRATVIEGRNWLHTDYDRIPRQFL